MKRSIRGVTLIEMVIATAVASVAMVLMFNAVRYLQRSLAQQMRLDRMSQSLYLTQEISRNIRAAKHVLVVTPDQLDLEVYDHSAFGFLDPRLYEHTKLVRYRFEGSEGSASLVREMFASTESAKPDQTKTFLKRADLIPPSEAQPFFFASFVSEGSTVGVRVALPFHPPYSKDSWIPVKSEVYVRAR